jgi:hypothetical protein
VVLTVPCKDVIDISRDCEASVSQWPSQHYLSVRNTQRRQTESDRDRPRGTAAMSEDRPADDQGEGIEAAVALSLDALAELVRLAPGSEAPS